MKALKIAALGATLALTACGSNPAENLVKNLNIKYFEDRGEQMIELSAQFAAESVIFPIAAVNVLDPKTGQQVALVQLGNTLDGQNAFSLTMNASRFKLSDYVTDTKLPNGNPIPILGVNKLYALKAMNNNTKIYLGETAGKLVVGAAVGIKEFDGLARSIPGSSIFFRVPGEVTGVAGFFTGTQSGTSGIGIFAQTQYASPLSNGMSMKMAAAAPKSSSRGPRFVETKPTDEQSWHMQNFFWKLQNRGQRLNLAK